MAGMLGLGFTGDSPGPQGDALSLWKCSTQAWAGGGHRAQTGFRGLWPLGDGMRNFGGFFWAPQADPVAGDIACGWTGRPGCGLYRVSWFIRTHPLTAQNVLPEQLTGR